jgi:dipeptidyl aminopeptidase/acylaminoacyl peptidase
MLDKLVGGFVKAKDAETVVFTQQRFEEFPNLWATDMSFASPRKISDANPQQAQYTWGRSELVDYVNADGVPLRAILTKPENFDPSKKYPMMVYIYEELTDGLHRFVAPGPGTSINVTRFVSNGYIVLQPDIVYEHAGYPGQAALKCVIPAVQRVVSMGSVDPKRIGIQGHSWGGYQITYLITQTDMFRAVEAGAAVSDMVSAYGGIRWGTGMSRAFQYEKTQSRIGAPPWERPLAFIESSPIFWVEKVNTPYLTIHNDDDDAVPWYQGIEFFSAMRRLGKEAYMFVYNGEKHGLRERENQKHWTVHQCEFFDHYLKDAPRPDWMDKGVPYLEKGKRDVTPLFKKADGKQ